MSINFKRQSTAARWAAMNAACERSQRDRGYDAEREPGTGNANIWRRLKGGKRQRVSFRTSQDRWLAYAPMDNGTKWKTLSEVDVVTLAVVNNVENPQTIQVYDFPAAEVLKRFDAAYKARAAAGNQMRDGWGMWINLEPDTRDLAVAVGSGLVADYPMVAEYQIQDMLPSGEIDTQASDEEGERPAEVDPASVERAPAASPAPSTIAEVMQWARERVAAIAGVRIERVKLELKVEY